MKIAVSACLLGAACRYDGRAKKDAAVAALAGAHELVPVCPEVLGGLPVPRVRCELVAGERSVRVVDEDGIDRTDAFVAGAVRALEIAKKEGCELAVLKAKSPSCGAGRIYDGTFTGTLMPGFGVAARAFRKAGIRVLNEDALANILPEEDTRYPSETASLLAETQAASPSFEAESCES